MVDVQMDRIQRLDYVQNFKRETVSSESMQYLYQVLDIAYHSETQERLVVYKALYGEYQLWVRPYDMFMGMVDKEKYPEIEQKYRFEKVDECVVKALLSVENKKFDFEDLKSIIGFLRGENGCPWDKKQTFESMKKCLKDESEEVFQAVDNQDMENLCEELGDVLLQIVMNSQIAKESELFTMDDVIQGVSEKLIRRHPHVFGTENPADTPEDALVMWKKMKQKEKEAQAKA